MFSIEPLSKDDIDGANYVFNTGFSDIDNDCLIRLAHFEFIEDFKDYIYNGLDIKLLYNNKMIGFYFLRTYQLMFRSTYKENWKEDLSIYENKKGLEGAFLCISKDYQRIGAGTFIINYIKTLTEFDYIWGGQDKCLNNINFWLKSRRIVEEYERGYTTLMDIK